MSRDPLYTKVFLSQKSHIQEFISAFLACISRLILFDFMTGFDLYAENF